jgi:Uma2 family endonuclease
MTADEFAAYAARHGRCELIRGEVRDLSPTGEQHGDRTNRLNYFISRHVYDNDLGKVYAAETGFRLDDEGEPTVRAPDTAFVAKGRVSDTSKFAPVAPDLVVETLSPSDAASEVTEKVQWWLGHGVRQVWVLDPQTRTLTVHHPDGRAQRLTPVDVLTGDDVLPGFELPLRQLFT